ncbi:MAG: hypothetical protein IH946_10365 [Bacteroidetes bacterium]|nr:hypothetical protein [Bacteroidota bacterium]
MKRFAIVCYKYSIEVSPFLKNLCSYLVDAGFGQTDIYIDKLYRDKKASVPGAKLILETSGLLGDLFSKKDKKSFEKWLAGKLDYQKYGYIVAVDYQSLDLAIKAGVPISKIIYISFEGTEFMRAYDIQEVKQNIEGCGMHIIASKERADEINKYLDTYMDFQIVPVSMRPGMAMASFQDEGLNLIYSGYFTDWGCVLEAIDLYKQALGSVSCKLTLQGHAMATDDYLNQVKREAAKVENIIMDENYYDDEEHLHLIGSHNIGFAMYKNLTGTDNFENMLFSSGKIASYLWGGLAVVTNLEDELTRHPPFILVNDFSPDDFLQGVHHFLSNQQTYVMKAHKLAEERYNFDKFIEPVIDKLSNE